MSSINALPNTCTDCDTEPTPGVHLDPLPARHTLIDGDGTESLCTWCLVQLILRTEKYGSQVTLSIAPAPADAEARR